MGSDLLEKSGKSIREACHQKLEAACLIGEELGKIEKEELFRARGYASFETYLRGSFLLLTSRLLQRPS
jgi:hypothetical protein